MTKKILCVLVSLVCGQLFAQKLSPTTQAYIAEFSPIAIANMQTYGIPSSIILAQGILESGSGTSPLAKQGKNHFGIKCHNDWQGKRYIKDDDAKDECFRSYNHVSESFRDHALFLTTKKRYATLFSLDPKDYKGWAKGLKQAGYATNPRYPELLIRIIENYELHRYDLEAMSPPVEQKLAETKVSKKQEKSTKKEKVEKENLIANNEKQGERKSFWGNLFSRKKKQKEKPQEKIEQYDEDLYQKSDFIILFDDEI